MEHMKTKTVAFYLPQFHEIPENNDAWGNGFTEWVNVKKATPLFWGHRQPRCPLHHKYYNLLDDGVMEGQMRLAKKAGIYGFCFYHYWFNGRMVLERPAEMLLKNKKINFHYCFAWANESWTKTWHGAGGEREILIPQTYGGEEEWEEHYMYFRRFFMDKRYMKEDGKPILLIYKLKNISHFNDMIAYWNTCAKRDGFPGIFIISMNTCREHVAKSRWVDASVDFEPGRTRKELSNGVWDRSVGKVGGRSALKMISYKAVNKKMLQTAHKKNHFRAVFVDFDDTPRRGIRGVVTRGSSPKRFGRYLRETLVHSMQEENTYVFINAWNEWGEGNYLEPDTRYRYRYLGELRKALRSIEGMPKMKL